MNPLDIIGAMMGSGMSRSGGNRMGDILGQMMGGGAQGSMPGGPRGSMPNTMPGAGGGSGTLGDLLGSLIGGGSSAAPTRTGMQTGGQGAPTGDLLKNLAGAIFGGSAGHGSQAAGAGSMAIFGALAAQALAMAKKMMSGQAEPGAGIPNIQPGTRMPNLEIDDADAVLAGIRPPQTPHETQQVMDVATLTLKAMISAAKADGHIDKAESERLMGKLKEGGVTEAEQAFLLEEMQKPVDLDDLVRGVPNQQVAAQIYTASLMAIDVDTDVERRYMQDLASKLGLNQHVVAYLHQAVGVA